MSEFLFSDSKSNLHRRCFVEMTGLFGRGCLKKIKRSELPMGTRVISSRFHYTIKRHSAREHNLKVKRLKVRLVVQGQHMSKAKGDFKSIWTQQNTA
jgi:hypothetical protein